VSRLLTISTHKLLRRRLKRLLGYWGTNRSDWILSIHLLELALRRLVLQLASFFFSNLYSTSRAIERTWEYVFN